MDQNENETQAAGAEDAHDRDHDEEKPERELTPKEKAARGDKGQDQEPIQSSEDSSTLWDTDQHSDAPGPFGTGER